MYFVHRHTSILPLPLATSVLCNNWLIDLFARSHLILYCVCIICLVVTVIHYCIDWTLSLSSPLPPSFMSSFPIDITVVDFYHLYRLLHSCRLFPSILLFQQHDTCMLSTLFNVNTISAITAIPVLFHPFPPIRHSLFFSWILPSLHLFS